MRPRTYGFLNMHPGTLRRIPGNMGRLLLAAAYAMHLDAAAGEPLRITLDSGADSTRSYSSRPPTTLATIEGARVVLQRGSGKDYAVKAGAGGWSWFQVEQLPAQESYVAFTTSLEGREVTVESIVARRSGDTFSRIETTVKGELGEWIQLVGESPVDEDAQGRRYSTASAEARLAIRVEKAR